MSGNPTASTRRDPLITAMETLHHRGMHCGACVGLCCTHVANSMKISRQEAEDLRDFLVSERRWTPKLFSRLSETVRRYRLDVEPGDGRRTLRRTYTCPFYSGGTLGCTIAPTHKPYGCLAFNPRSPGLTHGGDCGSDPARLAERDAAFPEESTEPKLPIPLALLALTNPKP